ncbi:Vacuolar iron transporter 1 [Diplonema papillatum]|nr:Vacuolar iron transporter 1 [Diplonema papillatum]|eukprot:gene6785-10402_t
MTTEPYPEPESVVVNSPQTVDEKMDKARDAHKMGDIEASRRAHEQGVTHGEHHSGGASDYVKSVVFGGLDGIITTFAVVAATQGASDEIGDVAKTVLILGFANLFADGFSMGFGEFLSSRAELDHARGERKREEWEVENAKDMEKAEMVDLYCEKGFSREDSEKLVEIISKDNKLFVDIMMVEELGLAVDLDDEMGPVKSAIVMFVSFVLFGMVPLLVYLPQKDGWNVFMIACAATAATLFILGAVRGYLTAQFWVKTGFFMLLNGALAAGVSYLVGYLVSLAVGSDSTPEA